MYENLSCRTREQKVEINSNTVVRMEVPGQKLNLTLNISQRLTHQEDFSGCGKVGPLQILSIIKHHPTLSWPPLNSHLYIISVHVTLFVTIGKPFGMCVQSPCLPLSPKLKVPSDDI